MGSMGPRFLSAGLRALEAGLLVISASISSVRGAVGQKVEGTKQHDVKRVKYTFGLLQTHLLLLLSVELLQV